MSSLWCILKWNSHNMSYTRRNGKSKLDFEKLKPKISVSSSKCGIKQLTNYCITYSRIFMQWISNKWLSCLNLSSKYSWSVPRSAGRHPAQIFAVKTDLGRFVQHSAHVTPFLYYLLTPTSFRCYFIPLWNCIHAGLRCPSPGSCPGVGLTSLWETFRA